MLVLVDTFCFLFVNLKGHVSHNMLAYLFFILVQFN